MDNSKSAYYDLIYTSLTSQKYGKLRDITNFVSLESIICFDSKTQSKRR